MKMIINVVDLGTNYLVNNVYTDDRVKNDGFEKIEIQDTILFEAIKTHLILGEIVRLPKNVNPIKPSDIILSTGSDVDIAKDAALSEVMSAYNNRIGSNTFFYFYDYQVLNNQLIVAGYNITGDTKEDQYLNILSSGDSVLIDTLQKFLETQSKIEEIYSLRESVKDVLIQLNDSVDITSIELVKNTFLSSLS